ncbi:hypothetical protein CYMTET_29007 [Cymbomonas tetramitiformis]|uniref:Uncharacterized protein n=1 Tax=Cymbomonas tetramitiformis TaxID=36881 RepID=A0AAE0FLU9_9CHLO|nr:hypothetical protein CYMTET_29007 [Cymbomonas tetramitiformis]
MAPRAGTSQFDTVQNYSRLAVMPDTDGSVAARRCQAMGGYINHDVWDNRTSSCWRETIKLEDAARNARLSKKDRKNFRTSHTDNAVASIDPKTLELYLQRRKQPNVYSEGIRSAISPMLPKVSAGRPP